MKLVATFLFLISVHAVYSQTNKTTGHVSYTIEFDSMRPAKDGYWYDGYLFEIDEMGTSKLKGKTIKISGKFHTVKGVTKWTNKSGKTVIVQGREGTYPVVNKPKVKIIKD